MRCGLLKPQRDGLCRHLCHIRGTSCIQITIHLAHSGAILKLSAPSVIVAMWCRSAWSHLIRARPRRDFSIVCTDGIQTRTKATQMPKLCSKRYRYQS